MSSGANPSSTVETASRAASATHLHSTPSPLTVHQQQQQQQPQQQKPQQQLQLQQEYTSDGIDNVNNSTNSSHADRSRRVNLKKSRSGVGMNGSVQRGIFAVSSSAAGSPPPQIHLDDFITTTTASLTLQSDHDASNDPVLQSDFCTVNSTPSSNSSNSNSSSTSLSSVNSPCSCSSRNNSSAAPRPIRSLHPDVISPPAQQQQHHQQQSRSIRASKTATSASSSSSTASFRELFPSHSLTDASISAASAFFEQVASRRKSTASLGVSDAIVRVTPVTNSSSGSSSGSFTGTSPPSASRLHQQLSGRSVSTGHPPSPSHHIIPSSTFTSGNSQHQYQHQHQHTLSTSRSPPVRVIVATSPPTSGTNLPESPAPRTSSGSSNYTLSTANIFGTSASSPQQIESILDLDNNIFSIPDPERQPILEPPPSTTDPPSASAATYSQQQQQPSVSQSPLQLLTGPPQLLTRATAPITQALTSGLRKIVDRERKAMSMYNPSTAYSFSNNFDSSASQQQNQRQQYQLNAPVGNPSRKLSAGDPSAAQQLVSKSVPLVELKGVRDESDIVLSRELATSLQAHLPVRLRIHQRWNLLYSLNQHGVSFTSLLRLSKDKGPCLLLIRDENDNIFGGFLSEPISPHPSFYGSGECFLWKKVSTKQRHQSMPPSNSTQSWPLPSSSTVSLSSTSTVSMASLPEVKVFKWTGDNDYFIATDSDYVAMGSGNGLFGLWFDSDFEHGYSAPCPTFNNESLINNGKADSSMESVPARAVSDAVRDSQQHQFQLVDIEVWGF